MLSRNCKTVRAEFVLVAAIKYYKSDNFRQVISDTPDGKKPSLDLMRRRFDEIRDGGGQPDQFYLGTLPEQGNKRFAASLDSIHTIQLPTIQEKREAWISSKRIARLSDDHRRHLQARFFDAIAHEGFDDFRWWCDQDLELLITASQQHLHEADAQITKIRADIQILEGSAASKPEEKKLEGLRTQLRNMEQDRSKKASELEPYQQETQRRKQEAPKPTEE